MAHPTKPLVKIQQADKEAIATNQDHLIQMSSISPSTVRVDLEEVSVAAWVVALLTVLMGSEASVVE